MFLAYPALLLPFGTVQASRGVPLIGELWVRPQAPALELPLTSAYWARSPYLHSHSVVTHGHVIRTSHLYCRSLATHGFEPEALPTLRYVACIRTAPQWRLMDVYLKPYLLWDTYLALVLPLIGDL